MEVHRTELAGVVELEPRRFGDDRGWFSESWSARTFADHGIQCTWVQDNESLSVEAGTIRGIHFQRPPHAQDKLVRVVRGAVLDVAVDLRRSSPTFGRHVTVELTAARGNQLFIPAGFGHGFMTLASDTHVAYKASDFYAPETEGSIIWDDPDLAISWPPLDGAAPSLSEKDRNAPTLADSLDVLFD